MILRYIYMYVSMYVCMYVLGEYVVFQWLGQLPVALCEKPSTWRLTSPSRSEGGVQIWMGLELTDWSQTRRFQGRPKHNHNHNFPKELCIWCHIKSAFDDTSDEESLCFFCVPLCRRGVWCVIQKIKIGVPRDEVKNGCGCVWAAP